MDINKAQTAIRRTCTSITFYRQSKTIAKLRSLGQVELCAVGAVGGAVVELLGVVALELEQGETGGVPDLVGDATRVLAGPSARC